MKSMSILILFFCSLSTCHEATAQSNQINQVEWLVGFWNRTNVKPDRLAHERWEKISDTELSGWGISLRNGDTTFVEKLKIFTKDGTLYYQADVPENPAPVSFAFTSITKNGFVCENPDHDFPKKIEYVVNGDSMVVTTSGNGKQLIFQFYKTK